MKEQLNLTDAQAAKLKSHQEATQAKMKAIQDNDKLTPAEKKEQRKALAASSHKAVSYTHLDVYKRQH